MRTSLILLYLLLGIFSEAYAQTPYPPIQASLTPKVEITSATTTKVVAASTVSGQRTYVVGGWMMSGGTGNVTFEYGTTVSTPCDTGAVALSGVIPVVAQSIINLSGNTGPSLIVPLAGTPPVPQDLCIVTSSSATLHGWLAVTQF